jgi:thiamine transport system substrate-binding protein
VKRRTTTAALLTALLLAAACGDADQPTDPGADPGTTDEDTTTDEDMTTEEDATTEEEGVDEDLAGTTLTLVTHDSFDVSEDVLAAFTDETGIEVTIAPAGDAGSTVNQAILTQEDPLGDVLFGVDNTFLSRALDEDLFLAYESPLLASVSDDVIVDDEHRVTPIDLGDVCLNHDVAWFDDNDVPLPTDLADLTDPAYEGLLTVMNPATSSPGLAFLLATVERFGEDGYLDFWADLRDNDVLVTDGWSEAYYAEFTTHGGERPLIVSYASSPPAEVFFADDEVDAAPTGVIEASCFRQIEFAGILRGTEHEAASQRLIDFLLDVPFQEDLPLTMFVFPVNEDAELPDVFVEHAVVPEEPLQLDPDEIGEGREGWIEDWTATVLR